MIRYRKRRKVHKYVLAQTYNVSVRGMPRGYVPGYVRIKDGRITIMVGYAWDGPSGPAIDTKNSMRASLVHDALYQLMRIGAVSLAFRKRADSLYKQHCIEDGMSRIRAAWQYAALRVFGRRHARPAKDSPILTAPD